MVFVDIRCPHCSRLILRASAQTRGHIEVQCPRGGKKSGCHWRGVFMFADRIIPASTLSPSAQVVNGHPSP